MVGCRQTGPEEDGWAEQDSKISKERQGNPKLRDAEGTLFARDEKAQVCEILDHEISELEGTLVTLSPVQMLQEFPV